MNEATTDMVLLSAIEQFEDQTTTRVLMEEYEDSGTTQKEDVKKTPAKMLPSTHCMCTICIFVVNARNVKVESKKIEISVASVLSHIIHLDTKYLMVKTLGLPH